MLFIACMLGIKGLILGFFLHILLRSFWVSLIALSSMFKNTDHTKKIKLAKPFKNIENTGFVKMIFELDKLSAWVIYNTFTNVFIIAGWLLLFFSLMTLGYFLEQYIQ